MAADVLCLLSWGKDERRQQIMNEADPCVGYIQLGKSLLYKGRDKEGFFTSCIVRVVWFWIFLLFIFIVWVLRMQCRDVMALC